MDTTEALKRLLVALLVGLLIGLDRERAEVRKGRRLFAGVRTFPLIALLGGALSMLLGMAGRARRALAEGESSRPPRSRASSTWTPSPSRWRAAFGPAWERRLTPASSSRTAATTSSSRGPQSR